MSPVGLFDHHRVPQSCPLVPYGIVLVMTNQVSRNEPAAVGRRNTSGTVQGQTFSAARGSQAGDDGWEDIIAFLLGDLMDAREPG